MTDLDIVERLRRLPPSPSAYGERRAAELNEAERREAADEIEWLTGLSDWQHDEIERLRAEFELFREAPSKLEVAQYEIERLRAELELWKARAYAEGFVPAAERTA